MKIFSNKYIYWYYVRCPIAESSSVPWNTSTMICTASMIRNSAKNWNLLINIIKIILNLFVLFYYYNNISLSRYITLSSDTNLNWTNTPCVTIKTTSKGTRYAIAVGTEPKAIEKNEPAQINSGCLATAIIHQLFYFVFAYHKLLIRSLLRWRRILSWKWRTKLASNRPLNTELPQRLPVQIRYRVTERKVEIVLKINGNTL